MHQDEIEEVLEDAEKSLKPKPSRNKSELAITMFFLGMFVGVLLTGYACNESKHSSYIETPDDRP